ncbi:MAG: hypothetical protein A2W91_14960 [Bacteroidetes bacterium GWF2_38_335]|nr:MAG: hypothetical protein A2W91_14960 [Bacteroidetes bacterium GWF2_38_335]OFY78498.1 MAG: hypothetical protein A2281_16270 [Bacteroidetes bacterium RIFOXYA12_FULL_38_20]HBS88446.1 hypothetical protein [Bacteroidales bacterium]
MKYWILIIAILINGLFCISQNSVITITTTESGARFYAVLNGIQQNGIADLSLELKDIKPQQYTLMVTFAVQDISPLVKRFELKSGSLCEFAVVKEENLQTVPEDSLASNGKYKLILVSEKPLGNDYVDEANSGNIYLYEEYMKINGGNQNDNVQDEIINKPDNQYNDVHQDVSETSVSTNTTSTNTNVFYGSGYTGKTGCAAPMAESDFQAAKQSVASRDFEDSKLGIARQVATNNCLYASQVKELMKLFSFEDTRLEFAKFAWSHTYDIGNYFMVNDAFDFESSSKELDEYINRK